MTVSILQSIQFKCVFIVHSYISCLPGSNLGSPILHTVQREGVTALTTVCNTTALITGADLKCGGGGDDAIADLGRVRADMLA